MDSDIITKKDIKDLTIDDYKYFSRRYEIVSMAFIGFCVYGNVEILKWLMSNNIHNDFIFVSLFTSSIIFIIILLSIWHNLSLEVTIREEYLRLLYNDVNIITKLKSHEKSLQLEIKLKKRRLLIFIAGVMGIVLSVFVLVTAIYLKL